MVNIIIIVAVIVILLVVFIYGYILIANTLWAAHATVGDKVKFYELEDKLTGTIVKDNGYSVEVEYWSYNESTAFKQIAVISRSDIYKY